jgi:hypothetical protein
MLLPGATQSALRDEKHIPNVALGAGSNLASISGPLSAEQVSRVKNAWVRIYPSNTQIVAPNIDGLSDNAELSVREG